MVARAVRRTGSVGRFGPPPKPLIVTDSSPAHSSSIEVQDKTKVTSKEISDRLLRSFGELAKCEKTRQIIVSEVNNYLRLGRKHISDDDIAGLESRIRNVLAGGGPTRTTMLMCKRAIAEADEWARLYAFQDQLGEQKDEERREREAEQHAAVYEVLGQQVKEQERKSKEESAQEVTFARKQAEDVSKWRQQEDQKRTYQKEAMLRLKAAVEGQLAERQEQKKLETALRLQEECGMSAAMAVELKDKMEAEAADTLKAKEELRSLLLSNETNKAIKEKQRQEEQALDRKYAREYTEKLEMEDKARQEQIAQRADYQAKQAAIAQSLPESKRWIDPTIIERNFKAREEAEELREKERRKAAASVRAIFKAHLAEQIAERQAEREHKKANMLAEEVALDERVKREEAAAIAEGAKTAAKRAALRKQLEEQLEEKLQRKLTAKPAMTQTEREINADLLRRMYEAEPAQKKPVAFVV